ncbi:hypothetical protein ON010_g960 [Phytophthora cinnamomi]|nr:hypothetical protein ON010_g960 [Phytophthora cinnamomi]
MACSASDRAFVSASTGLTTITQSSGNFEISSQDLGTPAHSIAIGQVSSISDRVDIAGTFGGTPYANWTWALSFSLESENSEALVFNASVDGSDVANVYITYESPREEAFFGLGEQTDIGNLRGWRVPIWTREGGAGRGEEPITSVLNANPSAAGTFAGGSLLTTYTAVASLTSSLGRWIVLDGTKYALFNLASNATSPFEDTAESYLAGDIVEGDHSNSSSTVVEIQYEGASISGWLGRVADGNPLLGATGALTKITERQPQLPDWVNDGAILGGQDSVEGIIQDALNASLSLTGVWLQDWSGTRLQASSYGILRPPVVVELGARYDTLPVLGRVGAPPPRRVQLPRARAAIPASTISQRARDGSSPILLPGMRACGPSRAELASMQAFWICPTSRPLTGSRIWWTDEEQEQLQGLWDFVGAENATVLVA